MFQKGDKKPDNAGRQKGSQNELTKEAKELFISTLEGQVPMLKDAFEKVYTKSPDKYLELFCKYAQFFMPKKTDITSNGNEIKPVIIDWFGEHNNTATNTETEGSSEGISK